jgi:NADH-quinone oxidoreductase subunit L
VLFSAPLILLGNFISPHKASYNKFYFDELYDVLLVTPLKYTARFFYWLDRWLVDGLVNLVSTLPPLAGSLMRSLQMGLVQFYALAMVLGAIVLILARIAWANW